MIVYVLSTFLSMFFAFLYQSNIIRFNNRKVSKNFFAFLSSLPLLIVSGIRFNVGYDYVSYASFFKLLLAGKTNDFVEFGFFYLTKFIQIFSDNYIVFFFVLSLIFIYFTFKAIYEESPNPVLSIFLLVSTQYFFISMNGIRQFIALSMFLYSIRYIRERKLIPFLIVMLFASSIHAVSLILIPMYYLYNTKISPKLQIIVLSLLFLLRNTIKTIVYSVLLSTKYYYYIDVDYGNHSAGYITLAIELIVLILGWIFYSNKIDDIEGKKYNFYTNLKMFSVFFALINNIIPLLYRIRWCFGFSTIIYIPLIVNRINNKRIALAIKLLIYFFFSIYIIYTVGVQNANNVLPYRTIFDISNY